MTKLKKILTTAAALAVVLAPTSPASADDPSDEAGFVAHINALRTGLGFAPLTVDPGLTSKARAWAQTMASQNTIWHSKLSDGITIPHWRKLGENVGMGSTVDGLHAAFVKSPLHYANLVDPAFTSIGLGVVRGAGGRLFVSEEFMQVAPPAAPASPAATRPAAKRPVVKPTVIRKVTVRRTAPKRKIARRQPARSAHASLL